MGRVRLRSDILRFAWVLTAACILGLVLRRLAGPVETSTVVLTLVSSVLFAGVAVTAGRKLPLRVGAWVVVCGLLGLVILVPLSSDGLSTPILFVLPVIPGLAARLLGRMGPAVALAASFVGIGALLAVHGELGLPHDGTHPPAARATLLAIAVLLGATFAHTTEMRRRAGRRRLGTAEARYRMLFERSQDPVIVTTLEGRTLDLNDAAIRALGFADRDEALAVSVSELYVEATARDEVLNELRKTGAIKQRFSRLRDRRGREMIIAGSTVAERDQTGELTTLLTIFRDVTREHQREADLLEEARRDPLTGLPNRRSFEERLAEALERAARYLEQSAVLLLDLDGFKQVNDEHGHPAGDAVLRVVAERLAGIVRKIDTVARLGGDEFAVVNSRATVDGVQILAQRLIAAIEVPIHVEGTDFRISTCVGAAFCAPVGPDAGTPGAGHDTVVERADRALYRAKARGPGEIQIVPPQPALGQPRETTQ